MQPDCRCFCLYLTGRILSDYVKAWQDLLRLTKIMVGTGRMGRIFKKSIVFDELKPGGSMEVVPLSRNANFPRKKVKGKDYDLGFIKLSQTPQHLPIPHRSCHRPVERKERRGKFLWLKSH